MKWYDPVEGIGVITPDGSGREVCVHRCTVHGSRELFRGERVQFDIWEDVGGRRAANVRHVDAYWVALPDTGLA
ncbi:cold shock domain-containing protein [Streptomyces sp. 21So2-11]|uniref:cold-shock protein n=1 Tax=Streptomyces sp. 21So2-11 TaxID=3144408 RepID=UPI00321BDE48